MGEQTYSISAAVLAYAMAATLLVAIMLAAVNGWLAWTATSELMRMQGEIAAAHDATRISRIALERCDAKLEVVDKWVLDARNGVRKLGTGGK